MKRGLNLTLVTVAIALLCSGAFAYAPIIGSIPNVWIGDAEDNVGSTVDLNFFRFTNAFNFDLYVSHDPLDEDQSTTNVRWSFMADVDGLGNVMTDMVTINGIETIPDPTYSINPQDSAYELTAFPNNDTPPRATSEATFRDILDSPLAESPPFNDPVTNPYDSRSPLNTIITIYASNGTKADSREILVVANVDPTGTITELPDALSVSWPPAVDNVYTWSSPADDFTQAGPADGTFIDAPDGSFYYDNRSSSGGSIAGSGDATDNVYAPWESATDKVDYLADYVYRISYTLRTDQTDQDAVPNTRMMADFLNPATGLYPMSGAVRLGRGPSAPTTSASVYNLYVGPPDLTSLYNEVNLATEDVTNLKIKFEVIDFSTEESGTNYCDQIQVSRFATPETSIATKVVTYPDDTDFGSWIPISDLTPFGPTTLGSNATGLFIETAETVQAGSGDAQVDYGRWLLAAGSSGESFEADKLYRCVYTLQTPTAGEQPGKLRVYNQNATDDINAQLFLLSNQTWDHYPTTSGNEYSVWFETLPTLRTDPADNKMGYSFDISDGVTEQYGTVYLTKVELYYYSIP